jgi:hypothetical protein
MELVTNEIGKFVKKHEERLLHHVSVEAIRLLDSSEPVRRLNRKKKEKKRKKRKERGEKKKAFELT